MSPSISKTTWGAAALAILFFTQLGLAYFFQAEPEIEIAVLTKMAWVYLALAAVMLVFNAKQLPLLLRSAWKVRQTESTAPSP